MVCVREGKSERMCVCGGVSSPVTLSMANILYVGVSYCLQHCHQTKQSQSANARKASIGISTP